HGRNIVRFVPADLEQKLATIEREHCLRNGETFPDSIAKTVFESHPTAGGYAFHVIAQRYRVE
ncbi:MAG: hypothetical protein AAF802_07860, partial [Planctomycetota bacterium]